MDSYISQFMTFEDWTDTAVKKYSPDQPAVNLLRVSAGLNLDVFQSAYLSTP